MFATAYGVLHQGYCHLVVSSMEALMYGGIRRYSDVSLLRWPNLKFEEDGNLNVKFDHGCRMNSQFRQETTVTVSTISQGEVWPIRHLRELEKLAESDTESFVFRVFNGCLVTKSPSKTRPFAENIKYDQFLRYLSL